MASPQSGLPNFRVSIPQPMIFWNALPRTALYEQVACVINKSEQGVAPGESVEQTPHRVVPASTSSHNFYGQKPSFAEQELADKIFTGNSAQFIDKIRADETFSRRAAMGRRDDEENVDRREDWPASFHHLSRNIHVGRFSGVSADAALRKRFARRRIHHRDAHRAAGNREEPGVSDGGAEQRVASEGEDSAFGGGGFRARLGDAFG